MLLNRIPTADNLKRWHMANRCVLYLEGEENVDNLFVHCDLVHKMWNTFLTQLGVG